jgi:hypothetical protein
LTDRRSATKAEKTKARRERDQSRRKLGLKPGDGKEAHHKKGKGGKTSGYNNGSGNLQALSKSEHKKKPNNGRPKGSKDTVKRKSRKK